MGCGRVGATLAETLESYGHSVAVIDRRSDSFRRLGPDFAGRRVTGVGFDRETLAEAGIEEAYGFAAVSSGDNSNILAARVVREIYDIGNVVARIYDPHRAEVYQRLGITTVATVRWTADQMLRRILPQGATPQFSDASGKIALAQVDLHPAWVGRRAVSIQDVAPARLAFITRLGEGVLPTPDMLIQDGDTVHVLALTSDLPTVERRLAAEPKES